MDEKKMVEEINKGLGEVGCVPISDTMSKQEMRDFCSVSHCLPIRPPEVRPLLDGRMTFFICQNSRHIQTGDTVHFKVVDHDFDLASNYCTEEERGVLEAMDFRVEFISTAPKMLESGCIAMSIVPIR